MNYFADVTAQILILAMLGASLNLLLGVAGQLSMAHALFFGIGAYSVSLLTLAPLTDDAFDGAVGGQDWPLLPALAAAVIIGFVVALAISVPAVSRVTGELLILLTLAFQSVGNQLMNSLVGLTGGPYGLAGVPPVSLGGKELVFPSQAVWPVALVACLTIMALAYVARSPFGRLLRGVREHEEVVQTLGKATVAPKMLAFGISAAMAALAGGISASYYQFVAPSSYGLDYSILIIAVVVLGGSGNMLGVLAGAVLLAGMKPVLQEVVGDSAIAWQTIIYGLALVLLVRWRPQGLFPERATKHPDVEGWNGSQPAEVTSQSHRRTPESSGVEALVVNGVSKQFGGRPVVQDVSFTLQRGKITALVGPNGAGKTTIFNLVTGHLKPDSGSVHVNGRDMTNRSPHVIAQAGMARTFQDGRLFGRLSALENVMMAVPDQVGEGVARLFVHPIAARKREAQVREEAMQMLHLVGVSASANEIVDDLSYGDQKLVAIARLLATGCEVLLLDEPTSGVDSQAVEKVISVIKKLSDEGRTICLVEHSIHMVEKLSDHAIFLDNGQVIDEGPIADLMAKSNLAELYFGA